MHYSITGFPLKINGFYQQAAVSYLCPIAHFNQTIGNSSSGEKKAAARLPDRRACRSCAVFPRSPSRACMSSCIFPMNGPCKYEILLFPTLCMQKAAAPPHSPYSPLCFPKTGEHPCCSLIPPDAPSADFSSSRAALAHSPFHIFLESSSSGDNHRACTHERARHRLKFISRAASRRWPAWPFSSILSPPCRKKSPRACRLPMPFRPTERFLTSAGPDFSGKTAFWWAFPSTGTGRCMTKTASMCRAGGPMLAPFRRLSCCSGPAWTSTCSAW